MSPRSESTLDGQGTERLLGAVDLGSNSFHLVIARLRGRELHIVERMKETVRLRSGLSDEGELAAEARSRALACLRQFADCLGRMEPVLVRAVGTDALRRATDCRDFLETAEAALGYPIEVISGYEEARLIYAGATTEDHRDDARCLVLDIGGGSTEMILGRGRRPALLSSLGMGSVSLTERCFEGGAITRNGMQHALSIARGELIGVVSAYRRDGWDMALGASGTIRSLAAIAEARGWSEDGITAHSLDRLTGALVRMGRSEPANFPELRPDRVPILPGGLAVLRAVFEVLGLERMQLAPGALREGLLADMVDRLHQHDVRDRTVTHMLRHYRMDHAHAHSVAETAMLAWDSVSSAWGLADHPETRDYLRWAACLHEIGLAISHSQHHRHGAYILANADMAGFSRDDQSMLSVLARLQRKRLSRRHQYLLAPRHRDLCLPLACLLRVAIILNRRREGTLTVAFDAGGPDRWRLAVSDTWLKENPLLADDLFEEVAAQKAAGVHLDLGKAT